MSGIRGRTHVQKYVKLDEDYNIEYSLMFVMYVACSITWPYSIVRVSRLHRTVSGSDVL